MFLILKPTNSWWQIQFIKIIKFKLLFWGRLIDYTTNKNFLHVNLTMDSTRVLYADNHAISQFFTTEFEILSVKITKNAILTYFRAPFNIKQQYLKSKYFLGVIVNSILFDFQITTCF